MILRRFNPARALGLRTTIVLVVVALIYIDYYPRFSWFILGLAAASLVASTWINAHNEWRRRTTPEEINKLVSFEHLRRRFLARTMTMVGYSISVLYGLLWLSLMFWALSAKNDPEHWLSGISPWILIPMVGFIIPLLSIGATVFFLSVFRKTKLAKRIENFLKQVSEDAAKD